MDTCETLRALIAMLSKPVIAVWCLLPLLASITYACTISQNFFRHSMVCPYNSVFSVFKMSPASAGEPSVSDARGLLSGLQPSLAFLCIEQGRKNVVLWSADTCNVCQPKKQFEQILLLGQSTSWKATSGHGRKIFITFTESSSILMCKFCFWPLVSSFCELLPVCGFSYVFERVFASQLVYCLRLISRFLVPHKVLNYELNKLHLKSNLI